MQTLPDQTMANYLGQGVLAAYNAYVQGYTDPSQISLPGYTPVQLVCVFEVSAGGSIVFGFTAASDNTNTAPPHNILVLRGTMTDQEGLVDVASWSPSLSSLVPCSLPPGSSTSYGNVNSSLYDFYTGTDHGWVTSLSGSLLAAVEALPNPGLPLYIAGHSLGTAMTEICTLDIHSNLSGAQPQSLTLYNFASLYLGDATFVQCVTGILSESYMFANLCDAIPVMMTIYPTTPPNIMHVGYPCQFVWQKWEMWANHSMQDTYQPIIDPANNYWSLLQFGDLQYPTNLNQS
jgi:hypothetical protein